MVLGSEPERVRGVRGGGWKGEAVLWGGVYTPGALRRSLTECWDEDRGGVEVLWEGEVSVRRRESQELTCETG